jgi:hypothetical protein
MISRFISEIPEKVKGSFLVEIDEDNDAMLSKLLSDELDIDDFLDL